MDCESCGRHRPSAQVVPTRSIGGGVMMACGRCRRHFGSRPIVTADPQPVTKTRPAAAAA